MSVTYILDDVVEGPETILVPPYELPLTGLDKAFATFLQEAQPSSDPRHGMLAALASHQFGRGHACLDLGLLDTEGVRYLGWDARARALLPSDLIQAV